MLLEGINKKEKSKEKLRFQEVENSPVKWKAPGSFRAWDILLNINWEEANWMNLFTKICLSVSMLLLWHVVSFTTSRTVTNAGADRLHTGSGKKKEEKAYNMVSDLCFSSGLKEHILDEPHLLSSM